MNAIAQRLKSKTYWAAMIMAALSIVEAQSGVLARLLPAELVPFWPLIFPMVMMILREMTKTALSEK